MELGDESGPVLRLRGVTVRYGDRIVLDLPELSVAAGEVVAIMGPNGAGKSTLLHVAALLQRPQTGEVWIAGERAMPRTSRRLRRATAMVLQEPLLFDVSVLANAASGLRFRGVRRQEAERRARRWLAQFGVDHLAAHNARTLSGGEAQRVSLARAFAVEPELLLLDEPFSALDPATRYELVPELAARLQETRTAAVLVTHDANDAGALADRLLVLIDGCIAQGDQTDAVTCPHAVTFR
ncbi:MAG TPA: ATP-binding cassette domain-containing protein [Thermomicrobiales bacterium]|nr:ATP-binding cassette domain-containing protein [Thermomicrobiales bacterium]